jgi:hypothetical protein
MLKKNCPDSRFKKIKSYKIDLKIDKFTPIAEKSAIDPSVVHGFELIDLKQKKQLGSPK